MGEPLVSKDSQEEEGGMTVQPAIPFVRIDGGVVKLSSSRGAGAIQWHWRDIGVVKFFVTLFDEEGCELGLWDGTDYDEAIRTAEAVRKDWDIVEPVHDCVVGRAA
jgi:hypothetical protein